MAVALNGQVPMFVEIAPGGDPQSDGSDWVWQDITADVRNSRGVEINDGRQDEAQLVDAKTIDLDLNNGASRVTATLGQVGCYSPRNPAGPYFGRLRKNTPIRVGVRSADDEFGRTVSNGWGAADWGGDWGGSGDTTQMSVSGGAARRTFPTANSANIHWLDGGGGTDTDTTAKVGTPNAVTGGNLVVGLAARIATGVANYYAGWVEFRPDGQLQAKIQRFWTGAGGDAALAALSPIPSMTYTAGTYVNIRFQVDGAALRLKIWADGSAEPAAWTLTAQDSLITAGGDTGVYMWRLSGNTNATGPHFLVDSFHTKDVEAVAGLVELPVRWNMAKTDSWVPAQAAGIIRRLTTGTAPALNSPLYNQLVNQAGLTGLWLGDDGTDAVELQASDAWSTPAQLEGPFQMAADDTLPGAKTTFKLTNGFSRARGTFRRTNGGTGFSFMFFFKCDSAITSEHELVKLDVAGMGSVARVRIKIDAGGIMNVYGFGGTDDVLIFSQGAATGLDFTQWTAAQLETETVGSTLTWTMIIHAVGASTGFGAWGNTLSASAVRATLGKWSLTGNGETAVAYSTIYGGSNVLPFVDTNFALVSNGYQGETAGARMTRVFKDAGVPFSLEAGSTTQMGYQPRGDAFTIARDCEKADGGTLYERGMGLAYRPRRARYNRTVELSLDMGQGHIQPPEPVDDDRYEHNDITVTRLNGGSAHVVDDVRVALLGRYVDSPTINVFRDSQLEQQAGFRLSLGTVDDLRWPRFSVNFRRNFDLTRYWRSRTYGFRMQVAGEPAQILGSPPDVIVEGTRQVIRNEEWTVELFTSPAAPWKAGVYGSTRYDARGSLTVANKGVGSGGVYSTTYGTIYVNTPGKQWGTQTPYLIVIGKEVMQVNSVFTSGSDQGLNVTRSINGVVKTHVAGEEVHIADQRRWAL